MSFVFEITQGKLCLVYTEYVMVFAPDCIEPNGGLYFPI